MRYSDEELFECKPATLNSLKNGGTFNEFCFWACKRLKWLIEDSTTRDNWMQADLNHLRNYRAKAIRFYEQKMGK